MALPLKAAPQAGTSPRQHAQTYPKSDANRVEVKNAEPNKLGHFSQPETQGSPPEVVRELDSSKRSPPRLRAEFASGGPNPSNTTEQGIGSSGSVSDGATRGAAAKKEVAKYPAAALAATTDHPTNLPDSNLRQDDPLRRQLPRSQVPQVSILTQAPEANKRGVNFYNLNLCQEAVVNFTEAIRLDPGIAKVFFNRASAYYCLGHFGQAISDLERALLLEPGLPGAKQRLEEAQKRLGSGIYAPGDGVLSPVLQGAPEPKYTREARDARLQGTVSLQFVVDEKGHAKDIKVIKSIGLGLDEKAIEAVNKWRFKPGQKDGRPVPVMLTADVVFRLSK